MSQDLYYRFYQRLDEPAKIIGIPVLEFFMATGLMLVFLMKGEVFWAVALPVTFLASVRSFRQGKGRNWLTALAYWYLPDVILPMIFWTPLKVTPPSYKRLWLS